MSTTRTTNGRHVRQRKVNTKQLLRIIREADIEDAPDDEAQRHIPEVETGVDKAEEIVREPDLPCSYLVVVLLTTYVGIPSASCYSCC